MYSIYVSCLLCLKGGYDPCSLIFTLECHLPVCTSFDENPQAWVKTSVAPGWVYLKRLIGQIVCHICQLFHQLRLKLIISARCLSKNINILQIIRMIVCTLHTNILLRIVQ